MVILLWIPNGIPLTTTDFGWDSMTNCGLNCTEDSRWNFAKSSARNSARKSTQNSATILHLILPQIIRLVLLRIPRQILPRMPYRIPPQIVNGIHTWSTTDSLWNREFHHRFRLRAEFRFQFQHRWDSIMDLGRILSMDPGWNSAMDYTGIKSLVRFRVTFLTK